MGQHERTPHHTQVGRWSYTFALAATNDAVERLRSHQD